MSRAAEVGQHDTDALDRVTGSLQEVEPAISELNGIAVFDRRVRERRAAAVAQIDARSGAFGQFVMAGDEVGVQMGFDDDALDLQTLCLAASM